MRRWCAASSALPPMVSAQIYNVITLYTRYNHICSDLHLCHAMMIQLSDSVYLHALCEYFDTGHPRKSCAHANTIILLTQIFSFFVQERLLGYSLSTGQARGPSS